MSFDWSNRPQEFSTGVDPEAVFNDPRFAGAVTAALKKASSLRGVLPFGSVDPRALSGAGVITEFPARPFDGQQIRFLVDEDEGWVWSFIYHAAHVGDYKWFFTGGSTLAVQVAASESTSSTTYTDLATSGPSVTLPLPGVYSVGLGCGMSVSDGSSLSNGYMSPRAGSDTPSDDDAVIFANPNTSTAQDGHVSRGHADFFEVEANEEISAQYRVENGTATATFSNRYIYITPVRVRAF